MKFNNILPAESTQKDVFLLVEDSIRQFMKGINTTIFAYGQTGAGKTYSIIGNYSPEESHENLFNFLSSTERGILSRSLEMIMSIAAKEPKARFFVSFYQIYNEKIYDLYNNTNVGLDIRESKNGEISIPDLVTVEISKMQEAIQFLMIGLKVRSDPCRTGRQDRPKQTPRVPVPTPSSRSAWKNKTENPLSVHQYRFNYAVANRRFGRL